MVSITYDADLVADQAALAFGPTPTQGTSAPKTVTLTNNDAFAITITGMDFDYTAGGQGDDFLVSSSTCGGSLLPGDSCLVRVRFAPQGTGASASSLIVSGTENGTGNKLTPVYVALSGTATGLPQGPKGDQGDPGATGTAGPKGDQGDPGATGTAGPKGDQGDPGATGTAGAKGDAGANGIDGAAGADGKNGADGAAGAKGDAGTNGTNGATGLAGTNGKDGDNDKLLHVVECHRKRGSGARNLVCKFRYPPAKGARITASFRRNGVTVAKGTTTGTGGVQSVTLKARKRVHGGVYLVVLSYRSGGANHTAAAAASIR